MKAPLADCFKVENVLRKYLPEVAELDARFRDAMVEHVAIECGKHEQATGDMTTALDIVAVADEWFKYGTVSPTERCHAMPLLRAEMVL